MDKVTDASLNARRDPWIRPRRVAWAAVGLLSLALGLIGVVLPLLPTTPFILLAAYAFARSVPRWHALLLSHRIFGPIILDWQRTGAIAPRYKAMACGLMGATFAASVAGGLGALALAFQGACMAGAAGYVLTRPSR